MAAPTGPAAASAASSSQPPNVPLQKVRLGVLTSLSDAGNWIALAKGYFREQGLDIETHQFGGAVTDVFAPLGTGQIDVAGGPAEIGLANALSRGIDIRIVADKASVAPGFGFNAILVRKDLYDSGAIRGPADLKGRKFALTSLVTGATQVMLDMFFKPAGVSLGDLDQTQVSFPDMPAAFANKSVEAGMMIEPFVTQIVANGDGVILARGDAVYPTQQNAVIFYSGSFAREKPELARKFMVAYLKAVRDYNDAFVKKDPAQRATVIDILSKSTTVKDKALYDRMAVPHINPDGEVNIASLKNDQAYYVASGALKEPMDFDKVVDHTFVHYAVEQLGGPYK